MKKIIDLGKIGITLAGEYNDKATYEKLTIVLYKGKSYISTKTTQGVSPEKDIRSWQLVAEAKDAYHMLVDAGKTTLTEKEFLEQLVDATKGRYIIQGNIINAADEEDLTIEHSDLLGIDTLKLANRSSKDGMGYVILRKNKTFAEQMIQANTIYEIRYDFDLGGQTFKIPKNCILKFEGGRISNGNLVSTATEFINMKGALQNVVLSESIENPYTIVLDNNYTCSFKGFHHISLASDIEINGINDFIMFVDSTPFDFTLDGNNHKIIINSRLRIISDSLYLNNVNFVSSVEGENCSFYATPLDERGGASVYCTKCSFTNIYIGGKYKVLHYSDCTFDNCRQIYGWGKETPLYGGDRTFENCRFYSGHLNLTTNFAFVQVSYNGWNGKTMFIGCHFVNMTGINSDWIDTYDSCNVTITNCYFYSKKMIIGEGLINIKSHSRSTNQSSGILDSLGSKFNTIVTNNQFILDLDETVIDRMATSAIIRVHSSSRPDSQPTDDFNLRFGVLISSNIFTFIGVSRGASLTLSATIYQIIEISKGFKNLVISNNIVNANFVSNSENMPYVGYIFYKLTNSIDTQFYKSRMENCVIRGNIIIGNDSSVIYLLSPESLVSSYISLKESNPDNYNKVKPVFNVIKDNFIRSGSSGTSLGRNYNNNSLFDDTSNIMTGNSLYIDDRKSFYNTGINRNILNTTSLVPTKGDMIFNENIGKPTWWNGTKWVDATGANV